MAIFATIVMLAWVPAVLLLFAVLPPQRAVIVAFLGAWLYLPVVSFPLPFLPDYTKISATCAGIFAGAFIFDSKRMLKFRPRKVDLAIVVYCICPVFSSVTNGLGIYDGFSRMMYQVVTWGLPYLVGRIYFTNSESHRELAISMLVGGLTYVPLCLLETRLSPIFHKLVYGDTPRGVQMRFGGWRPSVFMDSGLQLGMWMTAVSLLALWLWRTGAFKQLWGVSANWFVWPILLTTILCRSTGALALLMMGLGTLWVTKQSRTKLALIALMAMAPTYVVLRTTGVWHGEGIIDLAKLVSEDRAKSFQFRVKNEDLLIEKALQQPLFGWGGWGRGRVYDDEGHDVSVTDGRWVIDVGAYGLTGLTAFFTMLSLPGAFLYRRFTTRQLLSRELAATLAMAVMVSLFSIDCVPNAMANPLFTLAGGAVAGLAVAKRPLSGMARAVTERGATATRFAEGVPSRRLFPHSPAPTGM